MTGFTKWVANYTQVVAPTTQTNITCVIYNRKPIGKIHAFVGGNGTLYVAQSCDSFTYTSVNITDADKALDGNLDTYAYLSTNSILNEIDMIIVDYGSVANRIIFTKTGDAAPAQLRIYTSSDGENWNYIREIYNVDPYTYIFITTLRYLKFTYRNGTTTTATSKIYEVWAVSPTNCYSITSTWESGIQKLSLGLPVYFVFVVPTAGTNTNTTYAIYEENVPASVQEVGVEWTV